MAQKKKSSGTDDLTIPKAISEVARGVASAHKLRPPHDADPSGSTSDDQPEAPQRSRAALQADIASTRVRLAELVDEIETRLDVPARAGQIADDFTRDPVLAARTHRKTTVAAALALVAVGTGIGLLIRAIVK
ncbi:DUF3618 domain-containing protein [Herbiconiux liangxiaofengii]|uniref:DUF3618 domain-containing protein n=1 Tax=Herbiconiux liangxiaofengii TaxID=3342795 RepID=UPI0035B8ECB0